MDLVLSLAEQDERIRIVTLEGSRANINIPKDEFQDYDITYFVSDIEPFISNDDWLNQFGNIIMMQSRRIWNYSHLKKRDFPILCYLMITIKLILPYCPWKS